MLQRISASLLQGEGIAAVDASGWHREFKPYDKAANARMDATLYHRRSLVETVISVLTRKYGAAVSSRV